LPIGLYISVPFCRTKCSYCNFASDVFSRVVFERYVERVVEDIDHADELAGQLGGVYESAVDSIFLGGGTPTILDISQLERLFVTISQTFAVTRDAEITVECAPGTLTRAVLEAFQRCGVNRVSLGVQSFVDKEAASVGRQHKRATVLDDIAHLRDCGIENINVDLIAGLPHQTAESWEFSVAEAIAAGVPHISVYMLEVDEDSRLGREILGSGVRYGAADVPADDDIADFYEIAVERLARMGIERYEISNFARPGFESRHNLKYWRREPYLGFGADAHSFDGAMRWQNPESAAEYVAGFPTPERVPADPKAEAFFLGLRLREGVPSGEFPEVIDRFEREGLLERSEGRVRLTPRGVLMSNEVFAEFVA
jgi:oxygen-independent coproporphyrinogen-3 oxidase